MYKIGIIQSSSTGAAPGPPLPNPVPVNANWTDVTHFILPDTYTFTTSIVDGPAVNYSININFDPSFGYGTYSVFRLFYRITTTIPVFDTNKPPDDNANLMAEFVPDPNFPDPLIVPQGRYLSFGVIRGLDYFSLSLKPVIQTDVVITAAANNAYIDLFNLILDAR